MKIERTKNTIRNTKWGVIQRVINLLLPFIVKTILIYVLSAEYFGLNCLFTSILQILSLTELGFSNAIVYSMYKPVAEDDKEKICALLNVYRKAYLVIGSIILVVGLMLTPFLPYLIKDEIPADINLYLLYLVYLINTVLSYFMFAYKTCLLTAHQREDLISKNTLIYNVICCGVQCITLILFRNYYVFTIVIPLSTIILNILNNKTVKKYFPDYKPYGNITKSEKTELKKKIIGLMIWKVGGATRNTFDSVVVSAYLGLTAVTMYNNYFFILNGVNTIIGVIGTSISAGVGNKVATDTPENNYKDFRKFHFYYMWIAGWCAICMMCLYQPFMRLWMGEKLMLPNGIMFLFCYYFIMMKQGDINSVYYQAAGLWWHGKLRSVIEAVLNISLNLILGKFFGIAGILMATIISFTCIYFYGSKFVYTEYFRNGKLYQFFSTNIVFLLISGAVGYLTFLLCGYLAEMIQKNIITLIINAIICIILPNIIFAVVFVLKKEYRDYLKMALMRVSKILSKRGKSHD